MSLSLALHCLVIDKKDPGGAQNKTLETLLQCFKCSFFLLKSTQILLFAAKHVPMNNFPIYYLVANRSSHQFANKTNGGISEFG